MDLNQRGVDYPFQFAMIAFNHVVPVLNSFAVTTGGEIKSTVRPPAVDGPVQIRPAAIDLHVGFIHATAKIGRVYASTSAAVFPFQAHNAEPSGKSVRVIDIHSAFSQHLLQLTVTDAVFAVPAYGPQNDVTLKCRPLLGPGVAPSAKGDDKFITTDYLQQCPIFSP